ncbi:MAG: molybdopterin-synthase adenylyltransferase MoeB [Desulfotomaculaceae bacterium]|nr:molybdopterin-synthase adenylyltransferase MoeB [Desulfotomaculaceae bacterium]
MSLTKDQLDRYSRHIVLDGVGSSGQEKILAGRALMIGAGGLASPAAYYLAAAGVGTIGLIDDDVVSISNLQRQILHFTNDVDRPKVVSAKEKLAAMNPECRVVTYHERLTASNVMEIIKDFDVVVDCTDNFETRFLANDACVQAKKPFFHGAVLRFFGQAMTILPGGEGPCYRCVFNSPPPPAKVRTSAQVGIMGVLPGTIGTIQATEVLKYFLGIGDLLVGKMLSYNALTMEFSKIEIGKNPNCPACGDPVGVHRRS